MSRPRPGDRYVRRLSQLRPTHWGRVVVRAARGFFQDNGTDLAAALTFWSLLSVFPAAVVVVALVELVVADEAVLDTVTEVVHELAPAQIAATIETRLIEVVGQRTTAGVLLSFGLLGALWTSSAYLRSFTRASNIIYRATEDRPLYRLVPQQLALTVVALLLVATVVAGLVVSGPVAAAIGEALGVEEALVRVWELAKWPVLLAIAALLLSLLFWVAPSVRQPRFRWLTVGGVVTLLVWAVVSLGFGFYVANFGAYDVTYGALGAVIVFLLWVFLTNCAVLLGVEVNAQLRRYHEVSEVPEESAVS